MTIELEQNQLFIDHLSKLENTINEFEQNTNW